MPITYLSEDIIRIPSGNEGARWGIFILSICLFPVLVVIVIARLPDLWWSCGIGLLCIVVAGMFPEREIDLRERIATFRLKFLQKYTIWSQNRKIDDTAKVLIEVKPVAGTYSMVQGYKHRVIAVACNFRLKLSEHFRQRKESDCEVTEIAESLAKLLRLPYEGYIELDSTF